MASSSSPHAFLRALAGSENTPPLFYVLLAALPIDQPAWLRVPAAVPGVLMCLVVYFALRRGLGNRAALLSALAVAVSPFLVTYSVVARGFILADLALLVALWAVLKLGEEQSASWWAVYLASGVIAIYTEYDSAIFLLALTATALWIGKPARKRMALFGALPLVALVPWIPQLIRAQHDVNVTKLAPTFPAPSLTALRDAAVTLAFGENGGTTSSAGRWLEFILIVALAGIALLVLHRTWSFRDARQRWAVLLIAGTAGLTLVGHAIAGAVGIDLFNQRYLTILIPLGAALGAAAIVTSKRQPLILAAVLLLLALGVVGIARRYRGEYEPDFTPIRVAALANHPGTVLSNTPVVLYYLRSLHPRLDRPYNLGRGGAESCLRPCLIIDDARVRGGSPRHLTGPQTAIGPFVMTLER